MADSEEQWSLIARALGECIRIRRKALGRSARAVQEDVDLSDSYYRSLEAGSIAPPPAIAFNLAKALDWNPTAVAELLGAIAYLRQSSGDEVNSNRLWLGNKNLITGILAASADDLVNAVTRHVTAEGRDAPVGISATGRPQMPWMLDLSIRRTIAELSAVPFTLNLPYMIEFETRYAENITAAAAILSYCPTGTTLVNSGFSFSFMLNKAKPEWTITFPVTDRKVEVVQDELAVALAAKFSRSRTDRKTMLALFRKNLKAKGRKGAKLKDQFLFDVRNNKLVGPGESVPEHTRSFHNAWLFRVAPEDVWIGFVDTYDANAPYAGVELAPLAIEDAERLANEI